MKLVEIYKVYKKINFQIFDIFQNENIFMRNFSSWIIHGIKI